MNIFDKINLIKNKQNNLSVSKHDTEASYLIDKKK